MTISKEYQPEEVEARWSEEWLRAGLFVARPEADAEPFCMVIPPPNITGDLHIGHVLVYTLHDVVARWRRMQGRDVLWLPGTDHAGIATQMVVERELLREGLTREAIGREAFERRVWQWKETYGDRIEQTLRRLGCSVDWTRKRFTLDEGLSRAVRTVFVRLYHEGLIYRDRHIVNWCPRCRTALSDLETVHEPVSGKLYTIRYAAGPGDDGVLVATTRPETMFGDTAVAVHPQDERYRERIGGTVRVPLAERDVPIVADEFVDPKFGTGAVKITPAHDPNDFQAARRLGLPERMAIDTAGRMTEEAGAYRGLDRFEARERVLDELRSRKLLVRIQDHEHAVGHCQRCGTVIEPLVSTQWFVRIAPLAEPAVSAVESGRTRFVPEAWSKTYFEWMRNIHDWCISRQLWWGHRIPAWHCERCAAIEVAEAPPAACSRCGGPVRQDPDVLDTWFSSALWPFSTLGWPESTRELERYYPTDLLITGHDIIFFWVARMLMIGLKFQGDVPFEVVYIHGLVRDAQGQKMSKTKGNTVDPLDVQSRYGTDAVRFTMAILAAPGNDIPLAPERMEGYQAFANKLWNATRFVLMKSGDAPPGAYRRDQLELPDRWILSRTESAIEQVDRALEDYRFDRAADALYHFVWHQFCDWYIEFVKRDLQAAEHGEGTERLQVVRAVLLEVLDKLLRMLHPFMPYVTEELWQRLPAASGSYLAVAAWPRLSRDRIDPAAEADVELLQELIVGLRHLRAESNIDPGRRIEVLLRAHDDAQVKLIAAQSDLLAHLGRASSVRQVDGFPPDLAASRAVVRGVEIAVPLSGLLDLGAERARLRKDVAHVDKELAQRTSRLANASFVERAPQEVVEKERLIQSELVARKRQLEESLAALGPEPGSP